MAYTTPFQPNTQSERGPTRHRNMIARSNNLVLDPSIVNPCALTNLGKEAKRSEAVITAAVKKKRYKYQYKFPATSTLLLLAVSICGILGLDTQPLIKAMAVRHVDFQDDMPTSRARAAAEGREIAQLCRRF